MNLLLNHVKNIKPVDISLPSSKSESNRVLIINALAGNTGTISNLSSARDTQTMMALLKEEGKTWDVIDAGTTMRFLTAFAATRNMNKILTGSARMQQRPIGVLVEALRAIGAEISYLGTEGYPPLEVRGLSEQKSGKVEVPGNISSQFISALLMCGPVFPNGLSISLEGKINSRPYIDMTIGLMRKFGAKVEWASDHELEVLSGGFRECSYVVESDWSGASYWYSFFALSSVEYLTLKGLKKDSFQGDQAIAEIMEFFGVKTVFNGDHVRLERAPVESGSFNYDFSGCPDLAQTVAVVGAALGIHSTLSGVESLRIKETDRIDALNRELKKIGVAVNEIQSGTVEITGDAYFPTQLEIETYDDHRMAMAFAPLALRTAVIINDPEVVNKSYPSFWQDVRKAGIAFR